MKTTITSNNIIAMFFVFCAILTVTGCELENFLRVDNRAYIQWATVTAVYNKHEKKPKIEVKIFFNKEVVVIGRPSISVIMSFSDEEAMMKRDAVYIRGSNSKTFVFAYFMDRLESENVKRDLERVKKYSYQFIPVYVDNFSFENGYIADKRGTLLPIENEKLRKMMHSLQNKFDEYNLSKDQKEEIKKL